MFQLRFPLDSITHWAGQYEYPGESEIAKVVAPRIREQGYCTQADLVTLCNWKSPRIRTRCRSNEAEFVKEVTRTALTTGNERMRIEVLTLLYGVGWPMASVILHWCHSDPYPILDFRALWSLSVEVPSRYEFEFWWDYAAHCRMLAAQSSTTMRELDRALWAYSKANQA